MRFAVALCASVLAAVTGCDEAAPPPPPDWAVIGDASALTDAEPHDAEPLDGADANPADAASDGSDVPTAPVTRPMVTGIEVPAAPSGPVPLAIGVRDGGSPTIELALAYACDDDPTWRPVTTSSPLTGLAVGPEVVTHQVVWDTLTDVDFHGGHDRRVKVIAIDPEGLSSEPLMAMVPLRRNLRAAARRVDDYLVHYGGWSEELVAIARRYQLVIVDPRSAQLTRDRVAALQQGLDAASPADDVIVLCYVSAGEDIRTASLTDDELRADPRFVGDGSGPRVDPRGPGAAGEPLEGIEPLGLPSAGGGRFASWYLDDNDVLLTGVGDGRPDRNAHFGGAFVNAGDPAWYDALAAMTLDGPDHLAGLDEILTDWSGRGLGCDGVFLDTYDTAAPDAFTDAASSNPSQFEWTAPGFRAFTARLRADYPDKVLLQNRGLFFFDPRHRQYRFTTAGLIDLSLFESFRLDSAADHEFYPTYHADNRFNVAPKLMAEANRGWASGCCRSATPRARPR